MVAISNFQDLYDESSKANTLSLPLLKKNYLNIKFAKSDGFEVVYDGRNPELPFAASDVCMTTIYSCRRLTAINDACKPVYEVALTITDSNFEFKPGDTIGIVPQNLSAEVDKIIDHLELAGQADLTYTLSVDKTQKSKLSAHIPVKCTLRHVLTHCVDIRSVVKKLFILALSEHTKDENERKILKYLCSKEGSVSYTTHILNKNLCILDIFAMLKSCKPPIEILLMHLPRLLPRPYSIINSRHKTADIIKICFSVMNIGDDRRGLTTGWLEDLILNTQTSLENGFKNLSIANGFTKDIPIYLRKNISGFALPEDWKKPLLLIGPGTGVAPFIGFLEEKQNYKKEHPDILLEETWLFFGCRNPELDFIYEEELNGFLLDGVLNNYITAFSRVENSSIKYVQDALTQYGERVVNLIEKGATVYVCGDHKQMATEVKECIQCCLMTHRGMTSGEAEKYICDMQRDKKYVVDLWS